MSSAAQRLVLPRPAAPLSSRESLQALLVLTALAIATRFWVFGNPVLNIDEQFYLLVAERMVQGDLPYVDIWDRKPIGLFLIYALAVRVFPDPVVGYQLLAALCVIVAAWLLFATARRFVGFGPALAGAAAYPAWLPVFGGIGGQSPVFYNLAMVAAGAVTLAALARPDGRALTRLGCAAMLLAGLAMQVKYTAVFEGIYFGVTLLWAGFRRGRSVPWLAGKALLWIGCALAPTLVAAAAYFRLGHLDAFLQANFLSVAGDSNALLPALVRLAALLFGLVPFWLCLLLARKRWQGGGPGGSPGERWILGWLAAAFTGFALFGVYFDHYMLPLLPPVCLAVSLAFTSQARARLAMVLVVSSGLAGGLARSRLELIENGSRQQIERLAALAKPAPGAGCLYVNEGYPALYRLTGSCLPTPYLFPQHLALSRYRHALGADQLAALGRLLASRPGAIVISTAPDENTRPAARQMLMATLDTGYRLAGTARVGGATYAVYRSLARPPAAR